MTDYVRNPPDMIYLLVKNFAKIRFTVFVLNTHNRLQCEGRYLTSAHADRDRHGTITRQMTDYVRKPPYMVSVRNSEDFTPKVHPLLSFSDVFGIHEVSRALTRIETGVAQQDWGRHTATNLKTRCEITCLEAKSFDSHNV